MNLKSRINFYINDTTTFLGRTFDVIIVCVNIAACVFFILGSYNIDVSVYEMITVSFFIFEYFLRFYVAPDKGRYVFSFYGFVDMLSIVPYFFTNQAFSFLRALKVFRILRFIRYLETEEFFFGKISKIQLQVLRTVFTILIIVFVASGFIYYAEASHKYSEINTFGKAFYFCVITLSTVGFGDLVPLSDLGRTTTVLMIFMGIVFIPWQAGKLVKLLVNKDISKNRVTCGNCGLSRHDFDASHCKACGAVIFQQYTGEGN